MSTLNEEIQLAKNSPTEINNLITKFEPMIKASVLKKTETFTFLNYDDAMQEGRIAFHKALLTFDETKSNFVTYAKTVISNGLKNYIKSQTCMRNYGNINTESLNNQGDVVNNNVVVSQNASPDLTPEEKLISYETITFTLNELNSTLSKFEKEILKLKLDGLNYNEIANQTNKTKKTIDNALNRIKNKIKHKED